jgi:transcriptional regulator with XRE-family HTH domain
MEQKGVTAYRLHVDTGIAKVTVYQWLNGVCKPNLKHLMILAKYFGVTLEELLN